MHVPLVVVGPGTAAAVDDEPVSTRRVFHTILEWAGLEPADQQRYSLAGSAGLSRRSLGGQDLSRRSLGEGGEVVLGEAMKPFLGYGWQPQIMAVEGRHKAILAGTTEVYDVIADPAEAKNLGAGTNLSPALRKALDDYPVPSPEAARAPENLSDEARRNLASLGYVSASTPPVVRKDAPRPADMVGLFDTLEKASGLFVAGKVRTGHSASREDPRGRSLQPRRGAASGDGALVARSGREGARRRSSGPPRLRRGRPTFAPTWPCTTLAARTGSRPCHFSSASSPKRPNACRQSRRWRSVRERQGRIEDAIALRQKIAALRAPTAADLVRLGQLAMQAQQTTLGDRVVRGSASRRWGPAFTHDLELGVLYLSARRFTDARNALDRVPPSHPEYPMALFKRAQVSVLLKEPDSAARIARARQHADRTTRELIARERLFQ